MHACMDVQVSQDISPVTKHATGSRDGAGGLGGKGGGRQEM